MSKTSIKGFFRKFSFRESLRKGQRESNDEGFESIRASDNTAIYDPRLSLAPGTRDTVMSPRETTNINISSGSPFGMSKEDESMIAMEKQRILQEKEKRESEVPKKLSASKKKKMIAEMENLRAKTLHQRSTTDILRQNKANISKPNTPLPPEIPESEEVPMNTSVPAPMNRSVPLQETADVVDNTEITSPTLTEIETKPMILEEDRTGIHVNHTNQPYVQTLEEPVVYSTTKSPFVISTHPPPPDVMPRNNNYSSMNYNSAVLNNTRGSQVLLPEITINNKTLAPKNPENNNYRKPDISYDASKISLDPSSSSIGPTSQDLSPRNTQEYAPSGITVSLASNSQKDLKNISQPNIQSPPTPVVPIVTNEFTESSGKEQSNRPSTNKSLSHAFPRRYDLNGQSEDGKSFKMNYWDKESDQESSILSEDEISHHEFVMTSKEPPGTVKQFNDLKKYISQSMAFPDKTNKVEILNKSEGMRPLTSGIDVRAEIQNFKLQQQAIQLEDKKNEVEVFSYSSGGLVQESLPMIEPDDTEIPSELNQVAYFKPHGQENQPYQLEEVEIQRDSTTMNVGPMGPYTTGKIPKRRTSMMEKVTNIKRDQQKKRMTQGPAQKYHMNEPTFAQQLQRMKKRDSLKPRIKEPEVKPVRLRIDRTMDHWVFKNLNSAGLEKKTQKFESKSVKEGDENILQQPSPEHELPSNGVFVLDGGRYGILAIKESDDKKMQGLISNSAYDQKPQDSKVMAEVIHVTPQTNNLLPTPTKDMIIKEEDIKNIKTLDASPTAQQILPDPVEEAATYFHDKFIEKEEKLKISQNKKSIISSGSDCSLLSKEELNKLEDDRVMLQSFASASHVSGGLKNPTRMKTVGELDDSYANYFLTHKL